MRVDRLPFQSIKNKHESNAVYRSNAPSFKSVFKNAFTTAAHSEMERQQPLWSSSLLLQKVCIPLRQRLWLKATFYEQCVVSKKHFRRTKAHYVFKRSLVYILNCTYADMVRR